MERDERLISILTNYSGDLRDEILFEVKNPLYFSCDCRLGIRLVKLNVRSTHCCLRPRRSTMEAQFPGLGDFKK